MSRYTKPSYLTSWTNEQWARFITGCSVKVNGVAYRGLCPVNMRWKGKKGRIRGLRFFPLTSKRPSRFIDTVGEFLAFIQVFGPDEAWALRGRRGCVKMED